MKLLKLFFVHPTAGRPVVRLVIVTMITVKETACNNRGQKDKENNKDNRFVERRSL